MRALRIGSALLVFLTVATNSVWCRPETTGGGNSSGTTSDKSKEAVATKDAGSNAADTTAEIALLRELLQQQTAQAEDQRAVNIEQQRRLGALEAELKVIRGTATAAVPANAINTSTTQPPAALAKPSATDNASPLFFRIGRADFSPGGFLDFTNVFRTKTVGSGIATSFGTIPYNVASSYPAAGLSEFRMSDQNSRLSLKIDSTIGSTKAVGFIETDLLGNNGSTMYVTSNSATFRLRAAFVDLTRNKWEVLAGQDWSLMTPNRKGLSPMTSDVFYSVDADSNYQMGVVWARQAQLRFVYHPSTSWALGVSAEGPQQFTGSGLTLPTAFISTQVDTNGASWGGNTNTPNLRPDLIAKIAYDTKIGHRSLHMDAAGISRTFKVNTFVAGTGGASVVNANSTANGAGVSFNTNLELFKNFHLIENAYWSDGGGRYLLGLAPDFVIRPANAQRTYTISPVHSGSALAGFEWQVVPKVMVYSYYSAVYVSRNYFAVAPNTVCGAGAYCGYGFPASGITNNRDIQEASFGISRTFWSSPELGKLVIHTQASYLSRYPWSVANGTAKDANLTMIYLAMKYVLP